MTRRLRYKDETGSPHFRCNECQSEFYGGGYPLHDESCSHFGTTQYGEELTLFVNDAYIRDALQFATRNGDTAQMAYGVSLSLLRDYLPDHVKRLEGSQ